MCPHGLMVITLRSRTVVEGLVGFGEDILDMGPTEIEVAVAHLTRKLRKQKDGDGSKNMVRLVRQLGCMPLPITQAAAYINQRAPRVTVSRYVR
jgi:hypothetical protein